MEAEHVSKILIWVTFLSSSSLGNQFRYWIYSYLLVDWYWAENQRVYWLSWQCRDQHYGSWRDSDTALHWGHRWNSQGEHCVFKKGGWGNEVGWTISYYQRGSIHQLEIPLVVLKVVLIFFYKIANTFKQ